MINTPNRAIMDSIVEKDFKESQTRFQDEKQPLEKSTIEDQGSIIHSSRIHPQVQIRQKSQTRAIRRILREYSFKDRSFQGKDRSLPFCNGLSKILGIYTPRILCQGLILMRQTALHNESCDFFKSFQKGQRHFWAKTYFFSDFLNGDRSLDWINLNH